MDRRTLLRSAAALSAVAVTPAAATIAATIEAPAIVTPAKLSPYANYVWEWFVSRDGETYYESFSTKEDATEYAKQCGYSIVAECQQQDYRLNIDGWWLLEKLNDDNEELRGEGDGIECTSAQEMDLEAMVQKAIEAWVVKHNIDLRAWSFASTRNETGIETADPDSPVPNGERK